MDLPIGIKKQQKKGNSGISDNNLEYNQNFPLSGNIVIAGDADTGMKNLLHAFMYNSILSSANIVGFDTQGILYPFLVPLAGGEKSNKIKVLDGSKHEKLETLVNPAVLVINASKREILGNSEKLAFNFMNIIVDILSLDENSVAILKSNFQQDAIYLASSLVNCLVMNAFGKDYSKYQDEARHFSKHILTVLLEMKQERNLSNNWNDLKSNLLEKPHSNLNEEEVESFVLTLEYYLKNSNLFTTDTPSYQIRPGNFHLFLFKDMLSTQVELAGMLILFQFILYLVGDKNYTSSPLPQVLKPNSLLVVDEFANFGSFVSEDVIPVIPTLISKGIQSSLLLTQDISSSYNQVLSLIEKGACQQLLLGKLKQGDILGKINDAVPAQELHSPGKGEFILIDIISNEGPLGLEIPQGVFSHGQIKPKLLDRLLKTPLLVKKQQIIEKNTEAPMLNDGRVDTQIPELELQKSSPSIQTNVKLEMDKKHEDGKKDDAGVPSEALVVKSERKPIETNKNGVKNGDVQAFEEPVISHPSSEIIEDHSGEEYTDAGHGDELIEMLESVEQDGMGFQDDDNQDFLSQFFGLEHDSIKIPQKKTGKITRLDYNLILDSLLFKLKPVVKAEFGRDFFKEMASEKSLDYEKSMSMYYEEARSIIKGGFASKSGSRLVYNGIKKALLSIIEDLELSVTLPTDAEVAKLEQHLIKAMDLPRGELLDRIKNGSLYF